MAQNKAPLGPVRAVVGMVSALAGVGVVLAVVGVLLGSGAIFGIGRDDVCVDARNGIVSVSTAGNVIVNDVVGQVRSFLDSATLCRENPGVHQRALRVLNDLPAVVVLFGSLVLAMRMFRAVDGENIFSDRLAARMRSLGWFVLVGEIFATLVETLSRTWLLSTMIDTPIQVLSWLDGWQVPVFAIFLGIVLISFARMVRISAEMRKDLEGTV